MMKKNLFLAGGAFFLSINLIAQSTCCSASIATCNFAKLGHDNSFVKAHETPLPFALQHPMGSEITFQTDDGKMGYAYELTPDKPSNNYIFVIHEWWGLNDYIKQECEKIFKSLGNVHVIAIDLYDKKVASTRDSAAKYMGAVKTERGVAIIKGLIKHVGPQANVGTIGWCFGGGWSLQAALLASSQSKACVMYYGMPEEKMEKLKTLAAPVLFIFGEKDQWINKTLLEKFENNMKAAKKSLEIKAYDADHAFANPSNPKYNSLFAEDAMKNSLAFLKKHLP